MRDALLAIALLAASAGGQVTPEEHAEHHPESSSGSGQEPGKGGMMEGMGSMMESMNTPPPKELYPTLMELDELPIEERAGVQSRAHERMTSGAARLSSGLQRLSSAAPGDDFAQMQVALEEMRQGLAEFDSGLAAHRALAEGRSPRNVALQWFKREMSLLDHGTPASASGPFGLSWFHFYTMTLLTVFAAVMVRMYFSKMRRATALLGSLTAPSANSAGSAIEAPSAPSASLRLAELAPAVAAPIAAGPAAPSAPPPRGTRPWIGQLRVVHIFAETPDIKTFRLMHAEGESLPFRHLPGQFLTLEATPQGKTVKRAYTIASSPTVADYVEITVKREEHGLVSRFLHDQVAQGDLLQVRAPSGSFTFTGEEADSIMLVGGGVGMTPLMSVIRYLTDRAWPGEITLLYCCRTTADFVFRDELEARQRQHPNLTVVATMTREAGTVWMGPKGRLTKELLSGAVSDIASRRIHVCGPPAMMEAMTTALHELGAPDENVHTEAFGPAKKPTAAPESGAPAPPAAAPPATEPTATATVTFATSGRSAPLPPDTPLLDVADQIGVEIDNSCRSGSCGSCTVRLLEGQVAMEVDDGLQPEDKAAGLILACQATSRKDVVVDA